MFDLSKLCPLIKEPCLQHRCQWFIQLQGTNPMTGVATDEWGCAVGWLPVLLIENAKEVRGSAAAIESFRNEMVRQQGEVLKVVEKGDFDALDHHS